MQKYVDWKWNEIDWDKGTFISGLVFWWSVSHKYWILTGATRNESSSNIRITNGYQNIAHTKTLKNKWTKQKSKTKKQIRDEKWRRRRRQQLAGKKRIFSTVNPNTATTTAHSKAKQSKTNSQMSKANVCVCVNVCEWASVYEMKRI